MERFEPQHQYTYNVTHTTGAVRQLLPEIDSKTEPTAEVQTVGIAGRLLSIRDQGKIVFADLHDQSGSIQVIADEDTPQFEDFTRINVGDWVGVAGRAALSRRGEPSVFVEDWARLARTEESFPSIKDGITDPEVITRQRYLDLAVNPESLKRFQQRSRIISMVRSALESQDFIEVETPILQTLYGGAAARPFETHHNTLDMGLYLRIAPELYLKRLVVGGLGRVYEIGKVFRNEGISTKHNPEFTMMEAYAPYWDHEGQMQLTENLVSTLATELRGTTQLQYQGRDIDLTAPWPRIPMDKLVSDQIGHEVSLATSLETLRKLCEEHDVNFDDKDGKGKLILELYEKTVEDDLWGPIFVTEYPKEVSPLARNHRDRPGYTERFEGIVAGNELCNGFSELNDPREQFLRFKDQEDTSERDLEAMKMDFDYIRALKYGLPPTAGLGIGMDRLVMLLTNAPSIRDVILFPTNRPDGYTTSYEKT